MLISKLLSLIYNLSLQSGISFGRLTYSVIRSIHKKGDKTKITNYRLIPLLVTFSKIIETAVFNRLNQHSQANNILVPEMFGFRKGITIQQAVFILTDNILTVLNQWQHVGGIFCDLSKAFDCVNHETLVFKLNCYGILGLNIKWFESCLTNREQRVDVISQNHQHKFSSNWGAIKCGVPQGSILGPILFIIYVSGLPLNITLILNLCCLWMIQMY